jgi:hypothetical protein
MTLGLVVATLAAHAGDTRYESTLLSQSGGGVAQAGEWSVAAKAGYPGSVLRGQVGFAGGWTGLVSYETLLFTRHTVELGVGRRWLSGRVGVVGGELSLGLQGQTGLTPFLAPDVTMSVKLAGAGRVVPYLELATRLALHGQTTEISRVDGSVDRSWVGEVWCMPIASAGVGVAITPRVGLELGLDYRWETRATVSIPGAHIGVVWGVVP